MNDDYIILYNLSFSEHFAMNFPNTLQTAHLKGQDWNPPKEKDVRTG